MPPLILSKKEIEKFDFRKGTFKLRSIIISTKDNKKQESNIISYFALYNNLHQKMTKQLNLNNQTHETCIKHDMGPILNQYFHCEHLILFCSCQVL